MQPQNLFQWIILFIAILIIGSAVACFRSNSQNPTQMINAKNPIRIQSEKFKDNSESEKPKKSKIKKSKKVSFSKVSKSKVSKIKDQETEETGSIQKISINTATVEDLNLLPNISTKSAKKIVSWRSRHGSFFDFSEVQKIPGLSITTLKSLKKFTTCEY